MRAAFSYSIVNINQGLLESLSFIINEMLSNRKKQFIFVSMN